MDMDVCEKSGGRLFSPDTPSVQGEESKPSFCVLAVDEQGVEIHDFTAPTDYRDVKAMWGEIKEMKHSEDYKSVLFRLPNGVQYAFHINDVHYYAFMREIPPYVAKQLDMGFVGELFDTLDECAICGYKAVLDSGSGTSCIHCGGTPWKPYFKGEFVDKWDYYRQKQKEYSDKIEGNLSVLQENRPGYRMVVIPFDKDLHFKGLIPEKDDSFSETILRSKQ